VIHRREKWKQTEYLTVGPESVNSIIEYSYSGILFTLQNDNADLFGDMEIISYDKKQIF
jgi:hypothetical protein